jgi:hypothetical protein
MNIRPLAAILLLICASTADAQSLTENQKVIIDQTIAYVKRLSVISAEWLKNPEKKEYRREMEELIKSYDKMKKNVTSVFILLGSEKDRITLNELLAKYTANKDELVNQLLIWKYQIQPLMGMEMLGQLDEIHEGSKSVLLNLQDEKSADDALSVLLSEDAVESRIIPLSKSLIDDLVKLQTGK